MTFQHHDGSAAPARLPDLISILGDAPSMENLRTLARVRRDYAERMVETLIDALDAIDGDPDLEPWLGSGNASPPTGRFTFGRRRARVPMADHFAFAHGVDDDREEQAEDGDDLDAGEEDINDESQDDNELDLDDDREPTLGAPEHVNQTLWGRVGCSPHEDEEDGWEVESECEVDERDLPGYREGMAILAEQDRMAKADQFARAA